VGIIEEVLTAGGTRILYDVIIFPLFAMSVPPSTFTLFGAEHPGASLGLFGDDLTAVLAESSVLYKSLRVKSVSVTVHFYCVDCQAYLFRNLRVADSL